MDLEQAAYYLAGIFDGEGSVNRISKTKRCWQVRIGGTEPEIIGWARHCLVILGIDHKYYMQRTSADKPWYTLSVHRKAAVALFAELVPVRHPEKARKLALAKDEAYARAA